MLTTERWTIERPDGTLLSLRIIDHGCGEIDAVIGDGDPYSLDPNSDDCRNTESIARALRFTKATGADFSGWIVESGRNASGSLPNKPAALEHLWLAVRERFAGCRITRPMKNPA